MGEYFKKEYQVSNNSQYYVLLRPCLPGLSHKYMKPYPITTRAKPEGLLDMAEWVCDKVHSRHGLSGLSHGNLLHSCFWSLSATFELLLAVGTAHVICLYHICD